MPRCPRRTADDRIDLTVETNLVDGHCFQFADLTTRAAFAVAWDDWGDLILPRYVSTFPGSRPFALYVLGELPPPAWVHPDPLRRHPFRHIEGGTVRMADTTWHQRREELEHLDALGLIDADEWDRAVARLESPLGTFRYEHLSTD